MKILSFDQSSVATGYAVFGGRGGHQLKDYGVIDLHKEEDAWTRIRMMCQAIKERIDLVKPDIVIIEDVSLRANPQTLIMLARLQGHIMEMAWQRGIPVYIYPPSTWRRIVGITQTKDIKRSELKKKAVALVQDKYNVTVTNDTAEAICIGLCYFMDDKKEKKDNAAKSKKS